jgi:RNA polymerase sigma-70 factor (ECF subfamily)
MIYFDDAPPMQLLYASVATPMHDTQTSMNSLETRHSLLIRIRDATDRSAWNDFFKLYAPLVYSYAIKHGFQDADASDVAQEVMCTVARSINRFDYDPSKGSFRGWLVTVARNCIRKRCEQVRRQATTTGMTNAIQEKLQAPSQDFLSEWDREYELSVFHWAAERVRNEFQESTWQAFWQTTVDGKSVESTANALGISLGAIYIARSRVLARIRAVVTESRLWEDER